jgi:hypothetical protein
MIVTARAAGCVIRLSFARAAHSRERLGAGAVAAEEQYGSGAATLVHCANT